MVGGEREEKEEAFLQTQHRRPLMWQEILFTRSRRRFMWGEIERRKKKESQAQIEFCATGLRVAFYVRTRTTIAVQSRVKCN